MTVLILLLTVPTGHAETGYACNLSTDLFDFTQPDLRLDRKISDRWSFGIGATSLNEFLDPVHVQEIAAGLFLSFSFSKGRVSSWTLDFGGLWGDLEADITDSNNVKYKILRSNFSARTLLGYVWTFGRPNFGVGAGMEVNSAGNAAIVDSAGKVLGHVGLASRGLLEFSFGVSF